VAKVAFREILYSDQKGGALRRLSELLRVCSIHENCLLVPSLS